MAEKDYAETLFDSIQTLIDSSVSSLNYDKTITCSIVSNDNKMRGEYLVSDGASTFYAYSDVTTYSVDTSVYVTIPQGDYNNKKIILGRRTSSDSEYFNYVAPSETFVDITGTLESKELTGFGSILANGSTLLKPIYQTDNTMSQQSFDRLCVKADFKTNLKGLNPTAGTYGLYIKVTYQSEEDNDTDSAILYEKTFVFSQKDMYGDVYNFATYFSQEAIYDISDLGRIKQITAYLYQGNDFYRVKSSGDGQDSLEKIPSTSTTFNTVAEIPDNIFVDNIEISLGYDLESFNEDTILVYTKNSTNYSASDSALVRQRLISARWVHKTDDGFISVDPEELELYNAKINWYYYTLEEKENVYDNIGGTYWTPIYPFTDAIGTPTFPYIEQNNSYNCHFQCDSAVQDEYIKAVVCLPSEGYKNEINQLADELTEYGSYQEISALLNDIDLYPLTITGSKIVEEITALYENLTNEESDFGNGNLDTNETALASAKETLTSLFNKTLENLNSLTENDTFSNTLQIHNTSQVQARLAVDLVQAITITVGDENDPYKGVYMVYGNTGEILNNSLSISRQKLCLSYSSLLTGQSEFDGDGSEVVSWKFPLTNTMIKPPVEGTEYSLNEGSNTFTDSNGESYACIQYVDDNGVETTESNATWAIISRQIVTSAEDEETTADIQIGDFAQKTTEQIFRIKDYYSSVGRNTIYCEIHKGGYLYIANITLIFGTAGTNGTDYTLRVTFNETALTDSLTASAVVYDYNNQPVTITNNVSYSLQKLSDLKNGNPVTLDMQSTTCTLKFNNDNNLINYYAILQASAKIEALGDTTLTVNTPVPWSASLNEYNHYEGPDKIIYNSSGAEPSYYKNVIKLYDHLDQEVENVSWTIEMENEEDSNETFKKFYPQIKTAQNSSQKILYSLTAPSVYIKDNHLCRLVAKVNDQIVWIQPLLIMQDAFSSALLNTWEGEVSIDQDEGTIMAPMLGAGRKNKDNSFSGVLIGDVKKAVDDIALTGVYGYQDGAQSFSLNENGEATFGISGKGQIQIDGNNGYIQSGAYDVSKKTGMRIDLQEGNIDAYNFRLNSQKITIDSSEDATDYFTIKGTGKITSTTYNYDYKASSNGSKSYLSAITENEPTTTTVTLLNVGQNQYYLQTLNYNSLTNKEAGLRLDLMTGKLQAYSGFNLTAINHKVKVDAGDTDESTSYFETYVPMKETNEVNDAYNFARINSTNYRNYYFTLVGDPTTYRNDWDSFKDNDKNIGLPFTANYEMIMNNGEPRLTSSKNYNGVWSIYYFAVNFTKAEDEQYFSGTSKEEFDNWKGTDGNVSYVFITSSNYAYGRTYFRLNNYTGIDTESSYYYRYNDDNIQPESIKTVYKKVQNKKYEKLQNSEKKVLTISDTLSEKSVMTDSATATITLSLASIDYGTMAKAIKDTESNNVKVSVAFWNSNSDKLEEATITNNDVTFTNIKIGSIEDAEELPDSIKNAQLYINFGAYMKAELNINADNNNYPIQLKLGDEIPFKLSWAGYLNTSKLKATGGMVGGWDINANSLSAGKIILHNGKTVQSGGINRIGSCTLPTYSRNLSAPISLGTSVTLPNATSYIGLGSYAAGGSGSLDATAVTLQRVIYSAQDIIANEKTTISTTTANFTLADVGQFYPADTASASIVITVSTPYNSTTMSTAKYYRIISAGSPEADSSFETTTTVSGNGEGIFLGSNGILIANDLYIRGGDGYWNGCAKYTDANTHTHQISGSVPATSARPKTDLYQKTTATFSYTAANDTSYTVYALQAVSSYTISGSYKGDSKRGINLTLNGTVGFNSDTAKLPENQFILKSDVVDLNKALKIATNTITSSGYWTYYNKAGEARYLQAKRYGSTNVTLVINTTKPT